MLRVCNRPQKECSNIGNALEYTNDLKQETRESSKMSLQVRLPSREIVSVLIHSWAWSGELTRKLRDEIPAYKMYDSMDLFLFLDSGEKMDHYVLLKPFRGHNLNFGVPEPPTVFPGKIFDCLCLIFTLLNIICLF